LLRRAARPVSAIVPALACVILLGTVATSPIGTVLVTAALLGYLFAWDRAQSPGAAWRAHAARLAVPALVAGTSLLAGVLAAVAFSVREPSAALLLALIGMAAAAGAVALALLPVIGGRNRAK
jgi:hypothetical protein